MRSRKIDPKYSQFFLDTCAFDPKYSPEDKSASDLWAMYRDEKIALVLAHSNQRELDHPNTPQWVRRQAASMIFTIEVGLTPAEKRRLEALEDLIQGNAMPGKHSDDAMHLFQASKYGGYFVTTDTRLLKMSAEIFRLCSVVVLLPSEVKEAIGDGALNER